MARNRQSDEAALNTLLCFIVVIPFWITLKFARLFCAKKKKTCTIYFFVCLIYSDALQSLDDITFYLLQTLNGHGYRCLGNEKMQSSFCFQPFLFYYFMFDKLENNFLLYMIISKSIYIYIFTQKYIYISIYIVNV